MKIPSATILFWILVGGLFAGAADQLSAFATLIPKGITAQIMLQYIASAAIGTIAFRGGVATAIFGESVHLFLTTLMAAVFVLASLRYPILYRRMWISGFLYGALICVVMNYVAVPLSLAPNWKPPQGWDLVQAFLASCFYVGLPIAAAARELARRSGDSACAFEAGQSEPAAA